LLHGFIIDRVLFICIYSHKEMYSKLTLSNPGLWAALGSSVFSSVSVIFQIQSIEFLSPYIVASLALLLGALPFIIGFIALRKLPSKQSFYDNLRPLLALIVLRCIIGNFLFVYSLSLTTGIKAMFFTKAEPYFVLFWYWLLQKGTIHKKHLALLLLHVVGAILLSTGGEFKLHESQLGDLLILLAMCCSSLSYFFGKDASKALGARVTNFVTQFAGGLFLLPFAILFAPQESWTLSSPGWMFLVMHILLFNVLSLTLWFQALRTVEAWIVSALRAIGPVVAAPLAWYLLKEDLNLIQIISAGIVLATSALIAREHMIATARAGNDKKI
jgi:drug/metabolite transporter (DMT)-like permease